MKLAKSSIIFTFLILGIFCFGKKTRAEIPTEGLQAYWNFDEGSGIDLLDSTDNNYNGVLTNGPLWSDGHFNGALDFDGEDDYIDGIGNVLNMGANTDFSISAWFQTTTTKTGNGAVIVTKRSTPSSQKEGWSLAVSGGKIHFHIADGTNYRVTDIGSGYNDGEWHHVVAVADRGSNLSIYVDGAFVDSLVETTVGNIDSTNDLEIAALYGLYHEFDGKIDELRIYTKALSLSEIISLYGDADTTSPDSAEVYALPTSPTTAKISWNIPDDDFGITEYSVIRDG